METKSIFLPAIRDDLAGDRFLIKVASEFVNAPHNIYYFDFQKCSVLNQNALAVLGGICDYSACRNTFFRKNASINDRLYSALAARRIGIKFDTLRPSVLEHLQQCHFLEYFEDRYRPKVSADYIGYRQHNKILVDDEIAKHLSEHWLTDEKLAISLDLKNEIVSRIFEIFMNAYGHGLHENPHSLSVISCGQYYEKERKLSLTVLDFGKGVVNGVQKYIRDPISDRRAMEWALSSGNSTRTDSANNLPRGLGFGILKDFVSLNKGSLKIYSNTCFARIGEHGEYEVEEMKVNFPGTMVTVTINCDDRYYQFRPKIPNAPSYF